ncbi:hypothetical protein MPTK1_4g02710 [Marchantia polymorpha subsp. ruderalis]
MLPKDYESSSICEEPCYEEPRSRDQALNLLQCEFTTESSSRSMFRSYLHSKDLSSILRVQSDLDRRGQKGCDCWD